MRVTETEIFISTLMYIIIHLPGTSERSFHITHYLIVFVIVDCELMNIVAMRCIWKVMRFNLALGPCLTMNK